MPGLLADLSRAWCSIAESGGADALLRRWSATEPALAGLDSLTSLAVDARGQGRGGRANDLDARDDVLRSLLRLADFDEQAQLAVLHVLAPGLRQISRTYAHRWGWSDTEAMVVTAALERIVAFGDRDDVRPGPNIVLGVRHDMFERRLREETRTRYLGRTCTLSEQLPTVDQPAPSEELLGLLDEGVRAGAITRRGARLIALHRIYGVSTAEVAAAEGRDAATVRKHRNRAEAALADVAVAVA